MMLDKGGRVGDGVWEYMKVFTVILYGDMYDVVRDG